MKKVALTGATGYLAKELINRLLSLDFEIHAIARDEGKLLHLLDLDPRIRIFPCSLEDYCLLKKAVSGCEGIFHLASQKHVNLSSEHTIKTVQSNITGSLNVLKLTLELPEIKYIIATSSDKAVKVSSIYGATKYIMENLFREYELINSPNCRYRIVRIGNVFHSSGSVLEKWKIALLNGKPVILSSPEATRFFITAEQVVETIFECLEEAPDSKPYLPSMKSVNMGYLLETMMGKYSTGKSEVKVSGLQPGENLHEFIADSYSSETAEKWTREELLKIL